MSAAQKQATSSCLAIWVLVILVLSSGCFRAEKANREFEKGNYSRAISIEPMYANAYYQIGKSHLGKGDNDRAIENFRKALSLDRELERLNRTRLRVKPHRASVHANLAVAHIGKRDYDQAVAEADVAVRLEPEDSFSVYIRGYANALAGADQHAISDYSRAISLAPDWWQPYFFRARAYWRQSRLELAIAGFSQTLRLNPGHEDAMHFRGTVNYDAGNYLDAIADLTRALANKPNDSAIIGSLSMAHLANHDPDTALACLRAGVKKLPNSSSLRNELAWLLATCFDSSVRDGREGLIHAERACELSDWKAPRCLDTLAACYAATGAFDDAVQWQKKALTFESDFDDRELERMRSRLDQYINKKPFVVPKK